MRVEPSEKAIKGNKPDAAAQRKIDKVTRIVALAVAFTSVFFFIIKILFL